MSGFTDEERRADAARRLAEQAKRDDKSRRAQNYRPSAEDPSCIIRHVLEALYRPIQLTLRLG